MRWLLWRGKTSATLEIDNGPSWTWFAVRGLISWDERVFEEEAYLKTNAHAELVRWRVATADGTAYGNVTEAVLEMRVVMFRVSITRWGLGSHDMYSENVLEPDGTVGLKLWKWISQGDCHWHWDTQFDGCQEMRKIFLIPMTEVAAKSFWAVERSAYLYCLVVERIGEDQQDVYRRIGLLCVNGPWRVVEHEK